MEFVLTRHTLPSTWGPVDARTLPPIPPEGIVAEEYRLIRELRWWAAWRDPISTLVHSALEFLKAGRDTGSARDALTKMATAIADLAVTGRQSYGEFRYGYFRSQGLERWALERQVRELLDAQPLPSPPNDAEIGAAIDRALDRAYTVAWALRGPVAYRSELRKGLDWIAVSAEDDMPHRPVNMPAPPFPLEQYEVQVRTPAGSEEIALATRFFVASAESAAGANEPGPSPSARQVPPDPVPFVPSDHHVLLFLHGHGSGAEEALELIPHLLEQGRRLGRKYALISFDLPNNGYSETFDHRRIAPSEATTFPFLPSDSTPIATPTLDFTEDFIIAFVDAVEEAAIQHGTPRIKHRIAAVIGGSLGGNLGLRLGRRQPRPSWLRNIVAWSPASVWWAKAKHDPGREGSRVARDRFLHEQKEEPSYRNDYFFRVYSQFDPILGVDPQPEYWYGESFAMARDYIEYSRTARQEIYNPFYRLWHWRLACEQLIYSHVGVWPGDNSTPAPYTLNTVRTLLAAGEEDDRRWVKIYNGTAKLGEAMTGTPGRLLLLRNTGHSIHTERPQYFASQIATFLQEDASLLPPGGTEAFLSLLLDDTEPHRPIDAALSLLLMENH